MMFDGGVRYADTENCRKSRWAKCVPMHHALGAARIMDVKPRAAREKVRSRSPTIEIWPQINAKENQETDLARAELALNIAARKTLSNILYRRCLLNGFLTQQLPQSQDIHLKVVSNCFALFRVQAFRR